MRIFLAGSRSFGAAVLHELLRRNDVELAGVSAPASTDDALCNASVRAGLPTLAAGTLSASTLPAGVDLIVAAHSHDFIGRATRLRARAGAIGYHPSLLPLHRGRDAVRWTIAMRDRVAGGSVYAFTDNVDAGPVLAQQHVFVQPRDTAESLWRRELFPLGVRLLAITIGWLVEADRRGALLEAVVGVAQDESVATWEPSWERAPLRRPDLLMLGDGGRRGE